VNQLNSFLSALKAAYNQQGQVGKLLLPGLALLIFCCLCSVTFSLFRSGSRNSPATIVPSLIVLTTEGTQATPTALFDFDFPTFTPFPTLPFATALPTLTPLPTLTASPTQPVPAATGTSLPTMTSPPIIPTNPPATAIPTSSGSVRIVTVDKPAEFADIQNLSNAPVDLDGWRLVSETGNQSCRLRGTLQPSEVLRVWSGRGNPGFDCRFPINIWNDNTADPAVLYNPQGVEVSRFP
jgi:hypothetical protein